MKKEEEGSITVFLSLVMVLILAVIMTTIEAARVNAAKAYSERALVTAMDSVLAEYYRPLFDEYHIFGLDGGYDTKDINTSIMEKKLKDCMEYTFNPGKGLNLIGKVPIKYFNLYGIDTSELSVNHVYTYLDFKGAMFTGQAVSYEKYKQVNNGVEKFLKLETHMKEGEKTQDIIVKKQEAEESVYEIDEEILTLMKLTDGISIGDSGIRLNRKGKIVIQDDFVKKVFILPVTMTNTGINNNLVYQSLYGYYVNPTERIRAAQKHIVSLKNNKENKKAAEETYQSLLMIDKSTIKDKNKLKELEESIDDARESIKYYNETEKELIKSIQDNQKYLARLAGGTLGKITESLDAMDRLIKKQKEVTAKILDYETLLSNNRAQLNEDLYKGLAEDLRAMEKYKRNSHENSDVHNYDFTAMKTTLLHNREILNQFKSYTSQTISSSEDSWDFMYETFHAMNQLIGGYSYKGLSFDYSTLVKPVESESFFKSIKSLLNDGILSLMVEDTKALSQKKITGTELPSDIHKTPKEKEPEDVTKEFKALDLDTGNKSLTSIFEGFGNNFSLEDRGEKLGEFLLFQEYLMDHFHYYSEMADKGARNALDYELEYIISGIDSDRDNLQANINKILLLRTMMNFITLMSDGKRSGEARTMAVGFVGFTGLPALVTITKTLILTVWAFVESLVDVSALLHGKMISILKSSSNIQIELYDIFLISKAFIKNKVDNMNEDSASFNLKYTDYLKMFLFMEDQEKKSFRSMDLIQENLQYKYEDTFFMKNCITAYQVSADFKMAPKFIMVPFVKEYIWDNPEEYTFHSENEYSY